MPKTGGPSLAAQLHSFRRPPKGSPVFFFKVSGILALVLSTLVGGCGPKYTYPAATVPETVERIALDEYKLEVESRVVGKTLAAVLYLDRFVDESGQIPKDVQEKMGQLMQVVTRVALSTDLPVEYCSVILRDSENYLEFNTVRSLDDVKRANADALGIEETMNRTLFSQNRYHPGPEGARPPLVIEEVRKEKFLANLIAQRIRYGLSKNGEENTAQGGLTVAEGSFDESKGARVFRLSVVTLKPNEPSRTILEIFKIVNEVLWGYRYVDFDRIEIQDYLNRQMLTIDRKVLFDYQQKKILDREILERFLTEFQSTQEIFKLLGFSMPTE